MGGRANRSPDAAHCAASNSGVIPQCAIAHRGCATWRRPGIHTPDRGYGFRARVRARPRCAICTSGNDGLISIRDTSGICSRCGVVICPSGGLLTGVSSPLCKNISVFTHPKSLLELFVSHPTRGAYHDRHERGMGCGGRGSVLRAMGSQGGFLGTCERSPARGREMLFADGKIVWS
jgi:hypothetical protein